MTEETGRPMVWRARAEGWDAFRRWVLRRGIQALGIGTFYVLIVLLFAATSPVFLSYTNALNILANASVIGIVTLGQAIVIISGGFDLSVSGTVPLGAVSYTLLINSGLPAWPAMALVTAAGALMGLLNGLIITRVGINPLVTTLGTLSITRGLAFTISGGVAIPFRDFGAAVLSRTPIGRVPVYVWAFLLLSLLSYLLLRHTVFGRMVYAVGGNREASRLAGIRVDLVSNTVYALSGALAAFAGVVVANQLLIGSATVGTAATLTSIAAVILGGASLYGGVGGIPGTLLGVLILGTIANGMALLHVPAFYQEMATGFVLLLAVGFGRLRALTGGGRI